MKKVILSIFCLMSIALVSQAQVVVNMGDNTDWQGYINGYYGVPGQTAVVYQNQLGSWADVATALFVAKVTHTTPERIIALRQAQTPWTTIAQDVNLPPNALFIPSVDNSVIVRQGPPYGKAWGYWKKHGNRIIFNDDQFENRAVLLGTSRFFRVPVATEFREVVQGTPVVMVVQREHEGNQGEHGNPGHRHGDQDQGNPGHGHEHGNQGEHGNPGHGHGDKENPGHGHGHDKD